MAKKKQIGNIQQDFIKQIQLINELRLHHGVISEFCKIDRGSFSDKMRGLRGAKFTEKQKEKIESWFDGLELRLKDRKK